MLPALSWMPFTMAFTSSGACFTSSGTSSFMAIQMPNSNSSAAEMMSGRFAMSVIVMAFISIGRSATSSRMMVGSAWMMPFSIVTAASMMSGSDCTRMFVAVVIRIGTFWMSICTICGSASTMPVNITTAALMINGRPCSSSPIMVSTICGIAARRSGSAVWMPSRIAVRKSCPACKNSGADSRAASAIVLMKPGRPCKMVGSRFPAIDLIRASARPFPDFKSAGAWFIRTANNCCNNGGINAINCGRFSLSPSMAASKSIAEVSSMTGVSPRMPSAI